MHFFMVGDISVFLVEKAFTAIFDFWISFPCTVCRPNATIVGYVVPHTFYYIFQLLSVPISKEKWSQHTQQNPPKPIIHYLAKKYQPPHKEVKRLIRERCPAWGDLDVQFCGKYLGFMNGTCLCFACHYF